MWVVVKQHSGSIPRNACVAWETYLCVATKKVWLPERHRQTDAGQSDPYVLLCFVGDTKTVAMFSSNLIRHYHVINPCIDTLYMYTVHVHARIWYCSFGMAYSKHFNIFKNLLPIVPGRLRWCNFTNSPEILVVLLESKTSVPRNACGASESKARRTDGRMKWFLCGTFALPAPSQW